MTFLLTIPTILLLFSVPSAQAIQMKAPKVPARALRANVITEDQVRKKTFVAPKLTFVKYVNAPLGISIRIPKGWASREFLPSEVKLDHVDNRVAFASVQYSDSSLLISLKTLNHPVLMADLKQHFADVSWQPKLPEQYDTTSYIYGFTPIESKELRWRDRTALSSTFSYLRSTERKIVRQVRIP